MKKISVVIPVYKAEKYLDKCIGSCINQTLKNFEVILVNDASPDNSALIMEKYETEYPDIIKCIYLKDNIRQGGARNIGIRIAEGDYLCFLDADDYLDEQMLECLYNESENGEADMICCNGYRLTGDKKHIWRVYNKFDFKNYRSVMDFTSQCYMIIKKSIIVDNELFFPERIFHEDTAVIPLWHMISKKRKFVDKPLYYRLLHEDSTTQSMTLDACLQMAGCMELLINNCLRLGIMQYNKAIIDAFVFMRLIGMVKYIKNNFNENDECIFDQLAYWRTYKFDISLFHCHMNKKEYIETIKVINGRVLSDMQKEIGDEIENARRIRFEQMMQKLSKEKYTPVFWGIGKLGVRLLEEINGIDENYEIADNSFEKIGTIEKTSGKEIRSFDWIIENVSRPIFIIASGRLFLDIKYSLQRKKEKVVLFDVASFIAHEITVNMAIEFSD